MCAFVHICVYVTRHTTDGSILNGKGNPCRAKEVRISRNKQLHTDNHDFLAEHIISDWAHRAPVQALHVQSKCLYSSDTNNHHISIWMGSELHSWRQQPATASNPNTSAIQTSTSLDSRSRRFIAIFHWLVTGSMNDETTDGIPGPGYDTVIFRELIEKYRALSV